MPIIVVLRSRLEDFHSGEFVKSCIFVPVFKEYVLDGYKLVKKNRSESRTFHRAPQTAP